MAATAGRMIRDLIVDTDTKDRMQNYARMQRQTLSDVVRTFVQDTIAGKYDGLLEEMGRAPASLDGGKARIGVVIDDETWQAFDDVAWKNRLVRSTMLRVIASRELADVPLDRKEITP